MDARRVVARRARTQADACGRLGSPLYAGLLHRVADDVVAGGPTWRVLEPFADWPGDSVYLIRLMGAVHRLVLSGAAPELQPHYAAGGDPELAWPAFLALVEQRPDELRTLALTRPVQTNEVGRCAALAPGILRVTAGMPVRLLELGAAAGLNLRWDAYRYEELWGDPASPVRLVDRYDGPPPPFEPPRAEVVERRGCDLAPVDPGSDEGRLTLFSYVWPDQEERMALLRGALTVAARVPAVVDAAPADEWLADMLAEPRPGCTTVVFHSVVWQYLPDGRRRRLAEAMDEAGARAGPSAPLAWLRMEPDGDETLLQATLWPGHETHVLARAGFHGRPVRWLAAR
jgi:hypothetical protein